MERVCVVADVDVCVTVMVDVSVEVVEGVRELVTDDEADGVFVRVAVLVLVLDGVWVLV